MTMYTVTQGPRRITVLATSMCDAICRAMGQLQHARGGITALTWAAAFAACVLWTAAELPL